MNGQTVSQTPAQKAEHMELTLKKILGDSQNRYFKKKNRIAVCEQSEQKKKKYMNL